MRGARDVAAHSLLLLLFAGAVGSALAAGPGESPAVPAAAAAVGGPTAVVAGVASRLREPLPLLLAQIVVVVLAARAVGALFARFGQPSVVGEMAAGLLLGPSFFGWLAPRAHAALFPPASLGALQLLSQIGVLVFLFVVGIDLDAAHLRQRSRAAFLVSQASTVVPFALGIGFAGALYPSLAPPNVAFAPFALFLGTALAVTAFPVLARILTERGLDGTPLGTTAIASAAIADLTAWCLLAVVVAVAGAQALAGALLTVLASLAFVALLLVVGRPLLARLVPARIASEAQGRTLLAGVLVVVFVSAAATEAIGIHALFGAFLAGVAMPPAASIREFLKTRLEGFASVFLLPLFFAFIGLRTEVRLLGDAGGWMLALAALAVAALGKVGGGMLGARVAGLAWGDAFALGALMNTRGLVELIVLDVGYDLGILSRPVFTILVLVALATTFATAPLLALRDAWRVRPRPQGARRSSETP